MGAVCSVLDSSLAEMARDGIIDKEEFLVLNLKDFDEYNETKTKIAERTYQVKAQGKMLFERNKSRKGNWTFDINRDLFVKVQKVKDDYNVKKVVLDNAENYDTTTNVKHYKVVEESNKNSGGLSTANFLDTEQNKEGYTVLQNLFFNKLGLTYNPNDQSIAGKENNLNFYKFLSSKGYSGLVQDNSSVVSFDFRNSEDIIAVKELENNFASPQTSLFNDNLEVNEPVLNTFEKIGTYSAGEVNAIRSVYSQTEIDDYMAKDLAEAMAVFNELLYEMLWKNNNFVSKDLVNNFNRICR
jgi:hypothetical protein